MLDPLLTPFRLNKITQWMCNVNLGKKNTHNELMSVLVVWFLIAFSFAHMLYNSHNYSIYININDQITNDESTSKQDNFIELICIDINPMYAVFVVGLFSVSFPICSDLTGPTKIFCDSQKLSGSDIRILYTPGQLNIVVYTFSL